MQRWGGYAGHGQPGEPVNCRADFYPNTRPNFNADEYANPRGNPCAN